MFFWLDGLVISKNDEFVFYRFLLGRFVDGLYQPHFELYFACGMVPVEAPLLLLQWRKGMCYLT